VTKINFDEWAELYRNNPEEFANRRKAVIEAEILKAPIALRSKLRVIQLECDAYNESLPPLAAVAEISKLMMSSVFDLQDSILDLGIECGKFDEIKK
jgi:hypothetical protein